MQITQLKASFVLNPDTSLNFLNPHFKALYILRRLNEVSDFFNLGRRNSVCSERLRDVEEGWREVSSFPKPEMAD